MAANRKKVDGLSVIAGLGNLDPTMKKAEEEPIVKTEVVEETPAEVIEEAPKETPKKKAPSKSKKRAPGRPTKYTDDEVLVVLGARIPEEQMEFITRYGGAYGGKTGYIQHLIAKEMERVLGDKSRK